jgi:PAS domain S-box-containing protein
LTGWPQILCDLGIWSAYLAIPAVLMYFGRRRRDLPFRGVLLLFGASIFFCGATHLMDVVAFWRPSYPPAGLLKLIAAAVSWATVCALVRVTPELLAFRGPAELEREVARRREAEAKLVEARGSLEEQVLERTRALLESGAMFRQLADAMPQIVWIARPDGHVEFHNEKWFAYTGLPREGGGDDGWKSVLHPDDLQKCIDAWSDSVRLGRPYEVESRFRNGTTGEYLWHLGRALPVRDESGRVVRWYGTSTDIDRRKRAEQRLKESERLYRAVGESIDYGVWACAPDGSNTYASSSFLKLAGISLEQCSEFGWGDILHPDEAQGTIAAWKECVRARGKWDREHRILGMDGQYHFVLARGVPVEDENGELLCWAGINLDISRQKKAEESLRELNSTLERRVAERSAAAESQRRLLDAVLDALPVAVVIADPSGRLTGMNQACEKVWGRAPMSRNIEEYREWVGFWPDTGKRIEPREWAMSRALSGESCPAELIEFVRFGDGSRRNILNTGAPVWGSQGEIIAAVVASLDVTDRMTVEADLRESEERFRSAFDDAPTGMAMLALDGRFLRSNRSLCELLGYSEQEILTTNFQSITFPDDLAADLSHAEELLAGRTAPYHMEKRFVHREGQTIHTLLFVSLVRDDKGLPLYCIKHVQDISERKRSEQLTQATLREKETLLKEVHHRVKNNLQIISTLLDLQSGHTTDTRALEMFKESRGRVRSMALIHERLYRAQDLARVDFVEYVRQLADDLYRAYRVSSGRIALEIDVDAPPLTVDIAIPCGLLINELVSNCLKHAFTGCSEGWLKVGLHAQGGTNVLWVADNGAGIPHDVDFRNTESFGLQLVNTLVDQLGGRIELNQGCGTEFIVRFPNKQSEAPP